DEALVAPFLALGVAREDVTFGHLLADECERLGISKEAYLGAYDSSVAMPLPGVEDMVAQLERWAVCSNKVGLYGRREHEPLAWRWDLDAAAGEDGEDGGGVPADGPAPARVRAAAACRCRAWPPAPGRGRRLGGLLAAVDCQARPGARPA